MYYQHTSKFYPNPYVRTPVTQTCQTKHKSLETAINCATRKFRTNQDWDNSAPIEDPFTGELIFTYLSGQGEEIVTPYPLSC